MRKTLVTLVALLALSAVVIAVAARSITHTVDASGTFSIHGTPPQAFANIQVIEIAGNDEYGWKATPPFYGFIRLTHRAQTDYKLFKPTIDGNKISFKTRPVGNISYEFEGTFSSLDFAEKDMRNQVVLSGTLKKLAAGKVTAEAKLDFDYTPGG